MTQGWECPRCLTVLAPHVDHCECRPLLDTAKYLDSTRHYTVCPDCSLLVENGMGHECVRIDDSQTTILDYGT